MFYRKSQKKLTQLLAEFPAVAILGARQVGKTTLAFQLADALGTDLSGREVVHIDFEAPEDMVQLKDPVAFFAATADKLVILDEVQRMPSLFPILRGVIDARKRSGNRTAQFVLLGSASADLLQQSAESLAGRLAYVELGPLTLDEVSHAASGAANADELAMHKLWQRGGFPDSYLASSEAASVRWRKQFISTYLERDIPQLGVRIPAETLRRFWTMLAHDQSQVFNAARLATSLSLSGHSVARYLDVLCDVMLVRRLMPWAKQSSKRLVRAPKVYVRDSGLVHALLGISGAQSLLSHPVVGGSWEGWVIENLIAAAPQDAHISYYRTSAGAEIDLVLDLPNQETWAIEVKRSSAPTISKGFYLGSEDVKATHKIVTSSNEKTFPMGEGVHHVPLPTLMAQLRGISA